MTIKWSIPLIFIKPILLINLTDTSREKAIFSAIYTVVVDGVCTICQGSTDEWSWEEAKYVSVCLKWIQYGMPSFLSLFWEAHVEQRMDPRVHRHMLQQTRALQRRSACW